MDPDGYAVGDDLAQRAALCTVSRVDNGMIKTPVVKSSDMRIRGAKTVMNQVNQHVHDASSVCPMCKPVPACASLCNERTPANAPGIFARQLTRAFGLAGKHTGVCVLGSLRMARCGEPSQNLR